MSRIWMQSLFGRPLDLVEPAARDVDFNEIAGVLARIRRYGGNAEKPVSVAQHTLIACDAAPEELRPWVLLHDAHEARTGDIITPAEHALQVIAAQLGNAADGLIVSQAIREFKHRHDVAIHAAAGLSLPTTEQRAAIKVADIVALSTERRDFMLSCDEPWMAEIEAAKPLRRRYRLMADETAAEALFTAFRRYLPALGGFAPLQGTTLRYERGSAA